MTRYPDFVNPNIKSQNRFSAFIIILLFSNGWNDRILFSSSIHTVFSSITSLFSFQQFTLPKSAWRLHYNYNVAMFISIGKFYRLMCLFIREKIFHWGEPDSIYLHLHRFCQDNNRHSTTPHRIVFQNKFLARTCNSIFKRQPRHVQHENTAIRLQHTKKSGHSLLTFYPSQILFHHQYFYLLYSCPICHYCPTFANDRFLYYNQLSFKRQE